MEGEGRDERGEPPSKPDVPDEGNSLKDASDEAVREMDRRRDGTGHAGAGDIG